MDKIQNKILYVSTNSPWIYNAKVFDKRAVLPYHKRKRKGARALYQISFYRDKNGRETAASKPIKSATISVRCGNMAHALANRMSSTCRARFGICAPCATACCLRRGMERVSCCCIALSSARKKRRSGKLNKQNGI